MNKHFGTPMHQQSMSQQKGQEKSTFCYDENIHTIEDLIAEVNKCQLKYDTKKKTNESLKDLLTKASYESDRQEKVYRDLQQSVVERKKNNAQSVQTLQSLRSCVKVTKDNIAMVLQENMEAREDLEHFKKVWIEKYNVNVNKLSNIESQYGNRLANKSIVQELQKEIKVLEQKRDTELNALKNNISDDKEAWNIMTKTIVEFSQLQVDNKNKSKKLEDLQNILRQEKYNLAKKKTMDQEKQAMLGAMHLEKLAKNESVEKQRSVTEVFKTTNDKAISDVNPKSIPRFSNLQQYMASWTGVQQKKLSSSLDSNTRRKDTPRPQSRFSTGMFVSNLKVPEFNMVKKLSEVTNQMVSPITKSYEVTRDGDSQRIQNKAFDVAKTQLKFNSPAGIAEQFGSPILGSKLRTFKQNLGDTSTKPKESKSAPSTLTKPNKLMPLKPFAFNVNSVQLKSVTNFVTDNSPSVQIIDKTKNTRLSEQSDGEQNSFLVSSKSKTSNSTKLQIRENEDSRSLCSDSGSWVTPESSLSSVNKYFTPDSSPSLPNSNLDPSEIKKVIEENKKDIQENEKDAQENIVIEMNQDEPQPNDPLPSSIDEQVGVNEIYLRASSEQQNNNEIISKDAQNMEQDNSQNSSQDFQEMELTLAYGTSSQGFNLSQETGPGNNAEDISIAQEETAASQKSEREFSVGTEMEVDPKVQQLTEDSLKQQESMDISVDKPLNSSSMIVEPPESANNSLASDVISTYFCSTPASQKSVERTSFGNISDLNQMDITMMEQSEPSSSNVLSMGTVNLKDPKESSFSIDAGHIELSKTSNTVATPQTPTESLSNDSIMQESDSDKVKQVAEHSDDVNKKSQVNVDIDTIADSSRATSTMEFSLEMSQANTKDAAPNALSLFGSLPSKIDSTSKETSSFNFSLFGDTPQVSADAGTNFSLFGDSQDSQSSSQTPGGGFSLFQDSQSSSEKPGAGFSLFNDSQPSSEKPGGGFSLFGNDSQPKADNDSNKTSGFSLFGDSQGGASAVDNSSSGGIFNFDFGGGSSGGEVQDGGGFSFNLFNTSSTSQTGDSSKSNTGGAFSLF